MSRSYDAAAIRARLDASPEGEVEITLRRRERAWRPGSTKRKIAGPAVVRYTRYPDGGVDGVILEAVR